MSEVNQEGSKGLDLTWSDDQIIARMIFLLSFVVDTNNQYTEGAGVTDADRQNLYTALGFNKNQGDIMIMKFGGLSGHSKLIAKAFKDLGYGHAGCPTIDTFLSLAKKVFPTP